jgi:hypothetical protein
LSIGQWVSLAVLAGAAGLWVFVLRRPAGKALLGKEAADGYIGLHDPGARRPVDER